MKLETLGGRRMTNVIVSRIAYAGLPQFDPEFEPRALMLPMLTKQHSCEWMIVCGSSMDDGREESIRDGDVIEVNFSDLEPRPKRVFVVHVLGFGDIVKRVREIDGELWLSSDNPDFEDFRVEEATIVGRVTQIVRMMNV